MLETMAPMLASYRPIDCPNCGRHRVFGPAMLDEDGVCEKCGWDVDGDAYASVTRPGACCRICHCDDVDLQTGACRDEHWHRLAASGDKEKPHG